MAGEPVQTKSVKGAAKPVVAKVIVVNSSAAPVIKKRAAPVTEQLEPAVAKKTAIENAIAQAAPGTLQKGTSLMNDTVAKMQETAKNFTAEATERANAMFGDMNARTKDAMAKGAKAVEEMVDFSKGNMEAVVASARVAAKGAEDIAKYSAEYGRKSIEEANATVKQFAGVKSPTEFFQLQQDVAKKQLDAVVAETSKFTESYLKLLGEIAQPLQNRYAIAVEKVKTAVAA